MTPDKLLVFVSGLMVLCLGACHRDEVIAIEQPPMTEQAALEMIQRRDTAPLTGGGKEVDERIKAYFDWHKARDSDPLANAHARLLHRLRTYWGYWADPKTIPDVGGWIAAAEFRTPGEGDGVRASELQTAFVVIHFGISEELARSKREDYILAWEWSTSPTGPHCIEPMPWVLRMRPIVAAEASAFAKRYEDAVHWREKVAVANASSQALKDQSVVLLADMEKREEAERKWRDDEWNKGFPKNQRYWQNPAERTADALEGIERGLIFLGR